MTPARTGRHDREHIIGVALDLLDRYGLPDLTMRRLAAELDVQASALYWHFDSKQDLIAAVSDRIMARIPDPVDSAELIDAARAVRDALLAHRDGAEVVMSSAALRPGPSRALDVLRQAMPSHREDGELAAAAVLQFVLGHTTLMQQRMHGESYGAASTAATLDDTARDAAVFETGIALISRGAARATAGR
ncbi:Tetracyclin repressor, C-terminal all-alpha domain [Microbacterium sp. 8M]|jgi:AcrR family transcriptional regulator|uniref:TetR family transcriptional regulator n=1 Tax=Microbacterium sp. 8M TaxID=2653153 RepID=UPI0012F0C5F7|nr:TetR family transcriptional regulator [Microbacterium sp. 8M]VXC23550.1 Tetracyclin repressor, C-terminal all-alpha domain [Microbacterium sp. 8M]